MTVEDAIRKIALLRRISIDKGALQAERETAHRLQKLLMERYAIKPEIIPEPRPTTVTRLNWGYWQELFDEFGLQLKHFGGRGSAEVGKNKIAYIGLEANRWWIDEKSPSGWQTKVRDLGIESLRTYLKEHAPKSYSFFRR
jgi:hypothetical protein